MSDPRYDPNRIQDPIGEPVPPYMKWIFGGVAGALVLGLLAFAFTNDQKTASNLTARRDRPGDTTGRAGRAGRCRCSGREGAQWLRNRETPARGFLRFWCGSLRRERRRIRIVTECAHGAAAALLADQPPGDEHQRGVLGEPEAGQFALGQGAAMAAAEVLDGDTHRTGRMWATRRMESPRVSAASNRPHGQEQLLAADSDAYRLSISGRENGFLRWS